MNINDLPDEILCHIFRCVEPYEDLDSCNLVCPRWSAIVTVVRDHLKKAAINNFKSGRIMDFAIVTLSHLAPKNICKHKNDFYAMRRRMTARFDEPCELYKLNLTSKTFEHVTTTGEIPQLWLQFQVLNYSDDLVYIGIKNDSNVVGMYFCNIVSRSWIKRETPVTASFFGLPYLVLVHEDNLIFYQYRHGRLYVFNFTTMDWWAPNVLNLWPRNLRLFHIYTAENNCYFIEQERGAVWRLKFNLASKDEAWSWTEIAVENSHQQLNLHDIYYVVSCTVDECAFCLMFSIDDSRDSITVALVVDFSGALKEDKVNFEVIRLPHFYGCPCFIEFTGVEFIIVKSF